MTSKPKISDYFGANLAQLLAHKIESVYPEFDSPNFVSNVASSTDSKTYTERIDIIATELQNYLPADYASAIKILLQILGPENTNETGMFTNYYWLMPVGKYVEKYGLNNFGVSMRALEEITKRNTGEYAIRPYARRYPNETIAVCTTWAKSKNFHLRRLASEGLRPKLPWATKLDVWNTDP